MSDSTKQWYVLFQSTLRWCYTRSFATNDFAAFADIAIVLSARFTISASYQQLPPNLRKRNNKPKKLRTMQGAHERIMLKITWRDLTAQWIREKTKVRDIMETLSKLKWNWAGHMARRKDKSLKSHIAFWTPYGHTRNRGKPRTRCRDDLLL